MRLLPVACLLHAVLLVGMPARAAHIIGGELSYLALGGNNYRVTLDVYRDCAGGGAPFDDPVSIFVYEAVSGGLFTTLSIALGSVQNISPSLDDPCLQDPPVICVERTQYTANLTLPALAGGYTLVYQRCCRNNTILNLIDPGNTGSTYVASIPDPGGSANSSPRFSNFPPLILCRDQPLIFDHAAVDPDGDVLTYELCRPFEGASPGCPQPGPAATGGCPTEPGPPPYGGVSYAPPYSALFPWDGSLSIDPVTGLLTGTPVAEGQYVVGICAREFRGGVQIGTHYRDFQFNVVSCDRAIVAATTTNILNCEGFTVSFDNTSSGASSFLWDFGVPGGTSTAEFPTFTFPDTGTYIVTLIAEPGIVCTDTVTVTVGIYPGADIAFDIVPACPGEPTLFLDQSVFAFGDVVSWLWEFGDGARTHLPVPTRSYAEGGTYLVSLVVTSSYGCVDSARGTVNIPHAPDLDLTAGLVCLGEPVVFSDGAEVTASSITGWFWDFGDGTTATGNPVTHTYVETGLYLAQLVVGAANGCSSDTTLEIVIRGPTVAEILPGDTICQDESLALQAAGGFFYQWTPTLGLNDPAVYNPLASPESTTTYVVEVGDGCTSDTAAVTVEVLPAPVAQAWPDTSILRGQSVQLFASGGVAYAWFPTDSLTDAGIAAPIAAPTSSTWYTVYVTAENGCGRFDSVFVEVLDRCAGLLLPNAFTPDGDGRNDAFRIQPIGDDQLVEMTVFNRWGELIFQSANAEIGWDGTYRGKPQPLGVYLYVLRFRCDGADFQKSGTVTLLR